MSGPKWWSSARKSSFYSILTFPERLEFPKQRGGLTWIGSGATLDNCASFAQADKTRTAFASREYNDFIADLTGLPRGGYELIVFSEFLGAVCFSS